MGAIQRFFIRAKHWQVFVLILGLLGISDVIALWWKLPGDGGWRATFLPLSLSTELCAILFAVWSGSLGTLLSSAISPDLRPGTKLFRIAVIFPAVYFPLFDIAALSLRPALFLAIFPLHVFTTFCLFYVLYFVSKSLVLAEKAVPVEFPHYIGTLFLIWFFPLGVWFTQPRINRLYAGTLNRQIGSSLRSE
jgi:hypothetical protein